MKLKTFFSFFIIGISLTLTLFLATPQICNKILPSLLTGTELEGQKIHFNYISPWKLIGNAELEKDGLNIDLPRFEIRYTPLGLIKKQVDEIFIDGLYIHINTNKLPSTPAKQAHSPSPLPLVFPLTVNKLTLQNSHSLVQGILPHDLSMSLNSTLFMESTQKEDGYHFTRLRGEINSQGDIISNIQFAIQRSSQKFNLSGNFTLELAPLKRLLPLNEIHGSASGRFQASTNQNITTIKDYSANIKINDFSCTSPTLQRATASGTRLLIDGNTTDLSYTMKSAISINSSPLSAQLQGQLNLNTLNGSATGKLEQKANKVSAQISHLGFETLTAAFNGEDLQYQNIHIQDPAGHLTATQHNGNFQIKTELTAKSLKPNNDIVIQGLNLAHSFYFNSNKELRGNGNFLFQKMRYLGEPLTKIAGTTLINSEKVTLQGVIDPLFTQNLRLPFLASYTFETGTITGKCNLNKTVFNEKKLPLFIQKQYPENISFSGAARADVTFIYDNTLHASAIFELQDGTASLGPELEVNGINTTIKIPDLLLVKSLPSQKLTINTISFNKIDISNVDISFRLENYNALFLEKSSFKWCNGRVESNSLLLSPENKNFQITLYCDRIGFSQLLGQLGIPGAEGTGSLNGRLPISYNDGKLFFDDGFLFSSPGDTGIIKFTNTETLTQSLGENIGAAHLEYSMRAIENFQYNWTTLSFNSKGENLTVAMKLDGKPAIPLPYAYKNGMMVRSTAGPGMQHPVNFNVNFHLPLTEILRYGSNIQSLMEKM